MVSRATEKNEAECLGGDECSRGGVLLRGRHVSRAQSKREGGEFGNTRMRTSGGEPRGGWRRRNLGLGQVRKLTEVTRRGGVERGRTQQPRPGPARSATATVCHASVFPVHSSLPQSWSLISPFPRLLKAAGLGYNATASPSQSPSLSASD